MDGMQSKEQKRSSLQVPPKNRVDLFSKVRLVEVGGTREIFLSRVREGQKETYY